MNSTLKAICALLKQNDVHLQRAAIEVLGAIRTREPGAQKAIGELLVACSDPALIEIILETIERNPHEQTLRYLLKLLEAPSTDKDERTLSTIAKIGGKAVTALKRHFERAPSPVRRKLVRILPRIRTPQAHAFLISCFFDADHELVREAVHALREQVALYEPRERSDLYARLCQSLKDKRLRQNDAALSALIIAMGLVGDIRCKEKILPYTAAQWPVQIRRHALMSLARFEYAGDKHHDVFDALFPMLAEPDYEGLVRYVIQVLQRIKPRRADNNRLRDLLSSPHLGVQAYAIQSMGMLDSVANAEKIIEFLFHLDPLLRETALQALRKMASAIPVVLERLAQETSPARLAEVVRVIEGHMGGIDNAKARQLTRQMLDLYGRSDERYVFYRTFLQHTAPEILQQEIMALATKAKQKKDYTAVCDYLKVLDHPDLITSDIRLQLAVAKIKTSVKDRSRAYRMADYALTHIAHLLREDPKGFPARFFAEPALDADDLLYVGFHFVESMNEERRFGADILRHIIARWPRAKAMAVAKQKLKLEGL